MPAGRSASEIRGSIYPVNGTAGHVAAGWEHGWLAFQSGESSRRLRPIPREWETTSEANLRLYLRKAIESKQRHA
jgi:NADH:ubiquinone oxidoreductase subunit